MADQNINITPVEGIGINVPTEIYNIDIRDENIVIEKKVEENTILIQETPNIDIELKKEPDYVLNLEGEVIKVSPSDHNMLYHRDLPDQHPIEAITDLREILNKLWTFTFEQGVASDTWVIEHNLGRKPGVVIVDSADNVFYPAVQYIDLNKLVVTMNGATTGKAYLN